MLYAFLDESYTADRYYVGAIIVEESNLRALGAALADGRTYAQGFGVMDPKIEYHAHKIMSAQDGWEALGKNTRAKLAIYRDVLRRIAALPVKMVIRGVDVNRLNQRYRYPYPPHRITLAHALEAIDEYAESVGDVVTVIADEIQGQAVHIAQAARYQSTGTGGYLSRKLLQIQMPIVFGVSAQSPGVQCADLYRRLDAHQETRPQTRRAVEDMWEILRPLQHKVRRWDP
ncbi:DUF3800 domain-containing protein [Plantibacter sp. Leaf314]|uniref:DUF3800 domain-containing protein n=1 Tax=Plantibacter sp. Leaf314 TaxID=1736333 RepID=UPI0006F741AF|nr:DUF3800 domain-containing protein [Plantibacter sp. Leaf314]KQQ52096.1 hypothetical protein ASF68_06885 [Plantibacter sp. Leaf314]